MPRIFGAMLVVSAWSLLPLSGAASAGPEALVAQEAPLPDTPQAKLVSGFLEATRSADEGALARFQEANFSENALKRYSREERLTRNKQLRDQAGGLTLTAVRNATPTEMVVTVAASNLPGTTLTMTFRFTAGAGPKIDAIEITG